MDGEHNEKLYFLMDDLGGNPPFSETPICIIVLIGKLGNSIAISL